MLDQGVLKQDPFSSHLFLLGGRRADLLKIVFWHGTGLCLEQSRFFWPTADEASQELRLLFSFADGAPEPTKARLRV
jgi:transposase